MICFGMCPESVNRFLRDLEEGNAPDIQRLKLDIEHAQAMYRKRHPKMETRCDWCGWPGARPIGGGNAACPDCLPVEES